jgi:hypothetical protein
MTDAGRLSDDDLLRQFIDTTLPDAAFHHTHHVRAAWLFVRQYGVPRALSEFSEALRRFAEAKGAPNLYHTTITWAYVLLINERQQRSPAATWEAFADANPDLLTWKPSVLDTMYSADVLWSDLARRTFVMPRKD